MDADDLRLRNHVYAATARDGRPPTADEAAAELGLDAAAVSAAYRRLHDAHALVLEPGSDRIRMASPFSGVPTPHRVRAGEKEWYANCAWDALAVPVVLGADAVVDSECADCGGAVQVEVRDGALVGADGLLVHILVPIAHWWDDIGFT